MSKRALLYGATGYTGRELALALADTDVILSGRSAEALAAVAEPLGLEWRAVALTDPEALAEAIADAAVVLHAAGPFETTAAPMMEACLRSGVHYMDLNGEWPVFLDAMDRDARAKAAGVMLLPGIGLTIAATDCLAAQAKARWPDTVRLRLGVSRARVMSQGSVESAARLFGPTTVIRRDGALASVPAGALVHPFDFGEGLREAVAVSWADVVTAEFSTGVRNVEVYSELGWAMRASCRATGLAIGGSGSGVMRMVGSTIGRFWPEGPSDRARRQAGYVMVAEATDAWRRPRRLRMRTLDGYTTSVITGAAAVRRVLAGDSRIGFQTPSTAYGPHFVVETGAAALDEIGQDNLAGAA